MPDICLIYLRWCTHEEKINFSLRQKIFHNINDCIMIPEPSQLSQQQHDTSQFQGRTLLSRAGRPNHNWRKWSREYQMYLSTYTHMYILYTIHYKRPTINGSPTEGWFRAIFILTIVINRTFKHTLHKPFEKSNQEARRLFSKLFSI